MYIQQAAAGVTSLGRAPTSAASGALRTAVGSSRPQQPALPHLAASAVNVQTAMAAISSRATGMSSTGSPPCAARRELQRRHPEAGEVASPQALRAVSHLGHRLPLHCTASGKAHLSLMGPARRLELLAGPLARHTSRSKTDPKEVIAEIEASARQGYFLDRAEFTEGLCAVAVTLDEPSLSDFSIAIVAPAQRFEASWTCTWKSCSKHDPSSPRLPVVPHRAENRPEFASH